MASSGAVLQCSGPVNSLNSFDNCVYFFLLRLILRKMLIPKGATEGYGGLGLLENLGGLFSEIV